MGLSYENEGYSIRDVANTIAYGLQQAYSEGTFPGSQHHEFNQLISGWYKNLYHRIFVEDSLIEVENPNEDYSLNEKIIQQLVFSILNGKYGTKLALIPYMTTSEGLYNYVSSYEDDYENEEYDKYALMDHIKNYRTMLHDNEQSIIDEVEEFINNDRIQQFIETCPDEKAYVDWIINRISQQQKTHN